MTLILSQDEIRQCVDMEEILEIVENTLRAHGEDRVIMPPKITLDLGEMADWPPYGGASNAMPAYLMDTNTAGIKWASGFIKNPEKNLPFVTAVIILNDPQTGIPLSVMDGTWITDIRTASVFAIAANHLARKNSETVAIIGAGVQGEQSLLTLQKFFNLTEVRVVDIKEEKLNAYVKKMTDLTGIDIYPHRDVEKAVRGADIVITCTTSRKPLVQKDWIKEGAFIATMGSYQELESRISLEADKIVVDNWDQVTHRGEFVELIESGQITRQDIHGELGDVVAGKIPGREREEELIVACPIGMGSLDIAVASRAYERACNRGLGEHFSFTEET